MSQQQFVRQNETSVDDFKLRLTGDLQPGAKKKPFLEIRILKNQPSLNVTTNVPEDQSKNNGKIRAGLDLFTFSAILHLVKKAAESPEANIEFPNVDCVGPNFRNGGKIETTESVLVGKKDGRIFIAVVAFGRPKIPFYFGPSDYHGMSNRDGSPADPAIISECFAMGWVDSMRMLLGPAINGSYVKRDEIMASWNNKGNNNNNNGNGNGNGNRQWNNNGNQGGNGGNNQGGNQSSDFDDDIPF